MIGRRMDRATFHARNCAARNRGMAAVFLGVSVLEGYFAWRNLSQPFPSERQVSIALIAGLSEFIALLLYLCLFFKCFRERLALGLGAAGDGVRLVVRAAPALSTVDATGLLKLSLLMWALAALASLTLIKSAFRLPPASRSRFS
jgi:hypothetical protein